MRLGFSKEVFEENFTCVCNCVASELGVSTDDIEVYTIVGHSRMPRTTVCIEVFTEEEEAVRKILINDFHSKLEQRMISQELCCEKTF